MLVTSGERELKWSIIGNVWNCVYLLREPKTTMADVEDDLTNRPLCCEAYEEDGKQVPRMLPYHHTVCQECVGNLLQRRTSVICPECRKQHRAGNGVKTFPQNKYVLVYIRKEKKQKLIVTLDKTKEDLRQWHKDLKAKDEEVKKIYGSFETRLTTEKERTIRMLELKYNNVKTKAYNELIGDVSAGINCDIKNAEAKIKLLDEMKCNSSRDITAHLEAVNKLQEVEEHNRRHQKRCIRLEDVKRNLDAVTLTDASIAFPMPNLKYTGRVNATDQIRIIFSFSHSRQ